ncbi:hypothetical protein QJS66_14290 [Kocuria rhizophila]|nr:hypothetical protein QJS66_14290 [Kocuria rhizophila]
MSGHFGELRGRTPLSEERGGGCCGRGAGRDLIRSRTPQARTPRLHHQHGHGRCGRRGHGHRGRTGHRRLRRGGLPRGRLRWLLLLLLAILLIAAIVLGFRELGTLTSQFTSEGAPEQTAAPADPGGSPAATAAPSAAAARGRGLRLPADLRSELHGGHGRHPEPGRGRRSRHLLARYGCPARSSATLRTAWVSRSLKEPTTARTDHPAGGRLRSPATVYRLGPASRGRQEVGKGYRRPRSPLRSRTPPAARPTSTC